MSSRYQKRKVTAETAKIVKHAKLDMQNYFASLTTEPTLTELRAWQAGYIAGINRANGKKN